MEFGGFLFFIGVENWELINGITRMPLDDWLSLSLLGG